MAKVSVIIPTFNRAHFLGETLESILAQTFKDWECLIIDDRSKDYTEELVRFFMEKDARISYHKRPESRPKGANACRNYGFEISKGSYVLWYDSDDLMKVEKIETHFNALRDSKFDFCVSHSEIFDERSGKILGTRFDGLGSNSLMLDYAKMKIGWMTPSVLWTKKYLKNSGQLFDEELLAAQEWEFHLRIISAKPSYCIIEKSLDLIRKHSSSVTYEVKNLEREWYYFLARLKIYENTNLNLDTETRDYLKDYLYSRFKEMARSNNRFVFKAYYILFLRNDKVNFEDKLNALLGILSFKITGKGNMFLSEIHT